jgi:hypothetical protein
MSLSLSEEFLRSFGSVLSASGFERVPKRATFHRVTPSGWHEIHAAITPYEDDSIVVALTAMVRFDAVESLVLKYRDSPFNIDGPNRATLGLFMTSDVEEDRGASATIKSSGDVQKAVAWAGLRCKTQGSPFFEAFATLHSAYEALVAPDLVVASFDFPASHERAKRILAAAVVLGHSGDLRALVARQRSWLENDPQAIASEFDDFARKLMRDPA